MNNLFNKLIFSLFFFGLLGCNNDQIMLELKRQISYNYDNTNNNIKRQLNFLEKSYMNDYKKISRFYMGGIELNENLNTFYKQLDSINILEISNIDKIKIINEFRINLDKRIVSILVKLSIKEFNIDSHEFDIQKIFNQDKDLAILLSKNNAAINIDKALTITCRYINSDCAFDIEKRVFPITSGNTTHIFFTNKWISGFDEIKFQVDTIFLNGRIVNTDIRLIKRNIYQEIQIDNLEKGEYRIVGNSKLFYSNFDSEYVKIDETFIKD